MELIMARYIDHDDWLVQLALSWDKYPSFISYINIITWVLRQPPTDLDKLLFQVPLSTVKDEF